MDFVYIDEVQDLTMRQISLFKHVCSNYNDGFMFSGDTAQTITKGVYFRFEDITSLFYNDFMLESTNDKTHGRKDKKKITNTFVLSQNFRTHAGILKLAHSVINLIQHFFPLSIDDLSPETSLLHGVPPLLLVPENNYYPFISIFSGSGVVGKKIVGFGAEQVILVRDEQSRQEILGCVGKQALVLTIMECKGLEFQDVLLYNFFGSSPLKNQWRVIYNYMKEHNLIDWTSPCPFPTFNEGKHILLCSELKQLYVAITRTIQRLWIFENEMDLSNPMFKYWLKLGLVKVQVLDKNTIDEIKVASSQEDWKSRGIKLFHQHYYEIAKICFERAGESYWERLAEAAGFQAAASRMSDTDPKIANIYLTKAAKIFDSIGKAESAAQCYFQLKEFKIAGNIYLEKCGESKLVEAGECFSLARCYKLAARVYARANLFSECLSACVSGAHFDMGLQYTQDWRLLLTSTKKRKDEIETHSQQFLERAALHHNRHKDNKAMMKFVIAFNSVEKIRTFLSSLGCLDELLLLEKQWGNFHEAANIAKLKGDVLLEIDLLEQAGKFKEAAILIICYVFTNSLWAPKSDGWPVKPFKQKEELLTKAKMYAEKVSEPFYEFICTEENALSDDQVKLCKMYQYLNDAQHKSIGAQILFARKILDFHFSTTMSLFKWEDNFVNDLIKHADAKISQNLVSVETLIYFWNFWKDKVLEIMKYLQRIETVDVCGEFCMNYLGVSQQFEDLKRSYRLLNPVANWVREIDDSCLKRKCNLVTIDAHELVRAAQIYWTSELLSVGMKVLEQLKALDEFSTKTSLSLYNQNVTLSHMFEVTKFLMESKILDCSYHIHTLQNFLGLSTEKFFGNIFLLDCQKSLTVNMILLRETEVSTELLEEVIARNICQKNELTYGIIGKLMMAMLGSGKLSAAVHQMMVNSHKIPHQWKACTEIKYRYIPERLHPIFSESLYKALKDTYKAYWIDEYDYMLPISFLYLAERLMILVSFANTNFYTSRSSFVEWIMHRGWNMNPDFNSKAVGHSFVRSTFDFLACVIKQLLFEEHEKWVKRSKTDGKKCYQEYYPQLVLRLFGIMCMIYLNSGEYDGLLLDLLVRIEISSQLPWEFVYTLQIGLKHDYVKNVNVIAEAFKKIGNPIVVVSLGKVRSDLSCPDGIFFNLKVGRGRDDILKVLFPETVEAPSCEISEKVILRRTKSCSSLVSSNFSSIMDQDTNLQLAAEECHWNLWDVILRRTKSCSSLVSSNFSSIMDQDTNLQLAAEECHWNLWDVLRSFNNEKEGNQRNIALNAWWLKVVVLKYINLAQNRLIDCKPNIPEEANSVLVSLQLLFSVLDVSEQNLVENIPRVRKITKELLSGRPAMEPILNQLLLPDKGFRS